MKTMECKKVIVHIGISKAGSTAIQRCLVDNKSVLKKINIGYPRVGIYGSDGIAHHKINSNLKNGSTRLIEKALRTSSSTVVVLSCEGFWALENNQVEILARVLSKLKVKIVLYLRNPHSYLPSSYRQKIKRAGEYYSPEEYFDSSRPDKRLDFSYQLERWSQYFPLRVRAYEAVKNSIEEDFMKAIGVPLEKVDASRRVVNTTPSDGAIRLMRLANRHLPRRTSRHVRRFVKWVSYDFNLLPPIEDDVFHDYAEQVIEKWDADLIRKHLPEGDWNQLIGRNE